MKKTKYKGWLIEWNAEEQAWDLYSPEELEQPRGMRYSEITLERIEDAKEFIDNY